MVFTISPPDVFVTSRIIAATASITIAMAIGMLTVTGGAAAWCWSGRRNGHRMAPVVAVSLASGSARLRLSPPAAVVAAVARFRIGFIVAASPPGALFFATAVVAVAAALATAGVPPPTCRSAGNNPHNTTSTTATRKICADIAARGFSGASSPADVSSIFNSPDAIRRRYSGSCSSSTPIRVCTSAATITPR